MGSQWIFCSKDHFLSNSLFRSVLLLAELHSYSIPAIPLHYNSYISTACLRPHHRLAVVRHATVFLIGLMHH